MADTKPITASSITQPLIAMCWGKVLLSLATRLYCVLTISLSDVSTTVTDTKPSTASSITQPLIAMSGLEIRGYREPRVPLNALAAPSNICREPKYVLLDIQNTSMKLPMLRLLSSKAQWGNTFWKPSKPYHVGIHWKALAEYSQFRWVPMCHGSSHFSAFWVILHLQN